MPLSILPTHPRYCRCTPGVWSPPLPAARLVDHPDRAEPVVREVREGRSEVASEGVAGLVVVPAGGDQELLERPHGGPGCQGDRLDTLTGQVGQQAPAVVIEVRGRPVLSEERPEPPQVRRECRPEGRDLLFGHRESSPADSLRKSREPALYC